MSSVNKVILIGNLGKDPEVRTMQNGGKVANLSLATSEKWKDKDTGEKKERTEWHRIVVFGNLAEIAERYLKKGSKVYLQGSLQTRKWQDNNGNDRYSTEVVLQGFGAELKLLDGRKQDDEPVADKGRATAGSGPAHFDDDIPFAPHR